MAASVVEIASASGNVATLATTPQPGDVLIACTGNRGQESASITGCGATWTKLADDVAPVAGTTSKSVTVWVGRGANTAGAVTSGGTSVYTGIRVFLVRGTAGTTAIASTSRATATATLQGPTSQAAPGQLVIDQVWTYPTGTPTGTHTPATGWTDQPAASYSTYLRTLSGYTAAATAGTYGTLWDGLPATGSLDSVAAQVIVGDAQPAGKRILMVCTSTGDADHVAMKGIFTGAGHTVVETLYTALPSDTTGIDLIVLDYEVTGQAAVLNWARPKWLSGIPILGGDSTTHSNMWPQFGIFDSTGGTYSLSTTLDITATPHPITTGYTGTVTIRNGSTYTYYSSGGSVAGAVLGTTASLPAMVAVEKATALYTQNGGPATAPARLVLVGWMRIATGYTTDGQTLLLRSVDWLTSSAPTPVAETTLATGATAGLAFDAATDAPVALAGKRLWLRAKDLGAGGSAVTTWTDASGSGKNATGEPSFTLPTVADGATPKGGKAVAFPKSGYFNLATGLMSGATTGEAWIVVKAPPSGNHALWDMGGGSQEAHFPYGISIYEDFGLGGSARYAFTPAADVHARWALYRVDYDGTTAHAYLDGIAYATYAGAPGWSTAPILGRGRSGSNLDMDFEGGYVAEVLVRDRLSTPQEVADLRDYFIAEHQLPQLMVTVDGVYGGSAAALLDGNLDTYWQASSGTAHWAVVTRFDGAPFTITGYSLTGKVWDRWQTWVLEGSNDGTSWTSIHEVTSAPTIPTVTYAFPAVTYSRYRLRQTGGGNFPILYELALTVPTPAPATTVQIGATVGLTFDAIALAPTTLDTGVSATVSFTAYPVFATALATPVDARLDLAALGVQSTDLATGINAELGMLLPGQITATELATPVQVGLGLEGVAYEVTETDLATGVAAGLSFDAFTPVPIFVDLATGHGTGSASPLGAQVDPGLGLELGTGYAWGSGSVLEPFTDPSDVELELATAAAIGSTRGLGQIVGRYVRGDALHAPIILKGLSGALTVNLADTGLEPEEQNPNGADRSVWLVLASQASGRLNVTADPARAHVTVESWGGDAIDNLFFRDTSGNLSGRVDYEDGEWGPFSYLRISSRDGITEPAVPISWRFVPSSTALQVSCEGRELDNATWRLRVSVYGAMARETVRFSVVGYPGVYTDVRVGTDGTVIGASVRLPGQLTPGTYLMNAYGLSSHGTDSFSFKITHPAPSRPAPAPVDLPAYVVPQSGGVQRWVLQDLAPGGLGSWVMPINPTSASSPEPERYLTPEWTVAADGQAQVWEGMERGTDWEFTGTLLAQADVATLRSYAALTRRFYVIDQQLRARVVLVNQVDLTPLRSVEHPWAHRYTVKCQVLKAVSL